MKTPVRSLTLATCFALALGSFCSLRAEDPQPKRERPAGGAGGFRGGGPGFDSLSQEEKDKLKAASEKAMLDSKVQDARKKMETASKDFRDAMNAAQIAADPSVEPILKKLQEAREKAIKDRGAQRPSGDQPKQ